MAKSKYAEQLSRGRPLLDEILDEQVGRLERALPKDRESTLRDWADLAGAEASVKDSYQGRYLFELIQNANDAIIDAQDRLDSISTGHHLVRLQLTDRSLLVANYGQPFDPDNVRALCRLHTTTKSASKQIGHKGIGFKSVLEICQTPEVYSDIHAFGYDGGKFRQDVERVMRSDWDPSLPLPMLRAPYPRYINQLPQEERERIEWLFDEGYVTVIRLPLTDPTIVKEVADRMGVDGKGDIKPTLLLFMTAISQIELCFPDGKEIAYYRRVSQTAEPQMNVVVLYRSDDQSDSIDSRWLTLGPVERTLSNRTLLAGLGKAWEDVNALRFSLAFPLAEDVKNPLFSTSSQPFYVYFPTEEPSGLRFAVQGDFHVGDDRKTLALNPLNEWLIEEICAYLATDGIELLKEYWPHDAVLVELLALCNRPEREFAQAFMYKYLRFLSIAPFVPIEGRHYKSPEESRLPPENVDQEQFRQLFPAARLRDSAKWAYPISEVVELERDRTLPFLLSAELGGQIVTPKNVVEALRRDGMPPLEECCDLVTFLADWFSDMPHVERNEFKVLLKSLPILPTVGGWQQPGGATVFQANLRSEIDDVAAPLGFDFSVIIRSVYPDTGTHSNQYALFGSLGAREYSARAIIRDAILPVLTDSESFEELVAEYPQSVFEAYGLLRQYFLDKGTTIDLRDRLARVPVPATDGKPDGWRGWKPASECYLGKDWPSGKVLEQLYAGFEDCYFLADIPNLSLSEGEDNRAEWSRFFCWLGVANRPRIIPLKKRIQRSDRDHFGDSPLWPRYIDEYDSLFLCQNTSKAHGYSRWLEHVETLHHFAELVQENDPEKLLALYSLLAKYWAAHYRKHCLTRLSCSMASNRTRCPSENVENYFLYQLKRASWLPAQIGGNWTNPLSPRQIWILGETDPTEVRALVPTLPPNLRSGDYQELASDLRFVSSSTAQVEDYIQLLNLLPEHYPLELPDLTDDDRRRWHRSVRAVFNWICERVQTGLVSRGDDMPPRPTDIRALAYREEQPCYVDFSAPELVYPDNNFLAKRWESYCAFLRINDDWQRLRNWLGVPDLSEVVQSHWSWYGELEAETQHLRERFEHTLPYYLALIKHSQPANYDRLLSRFERLRIHVAKNLSVEERLDRLPKIEPISSAERLHLEPTEDPNPRGGRPVRGGDLYVTKEVLSNLDLLGDYIAEYIEIARLGDAFIILINRDSDEEKRRFIESKGVSSEALCQVFSDLQVEYDGRTSPTDSSKELGAVIQKAVRAAQASVITPTPIYIFTEEEEGQWQEHTDDKPEEAEAQLELRKPLYPPLSFETLPEIVFIDSASEVMRTQEASKTNGRGGGRGYGAFVSGEITAELGHRGEEWAYKAERNRLAKIGLDPDELEEMGELVWVSRKQPTANYDIKSIRITEIGEQRDLYIEVKASSGDGRMIRMSRSEFELALSLGDDYWLYWVANTDTTQPDDPVCYPNLARLLAEKKIDLNVGTIVMTLPKQV